MQVKVLDVKQMDLVEITAMIDSGATVSAVHPQVVQQMGWQVFEVPKSMQGPVLNADDTENKHGVVRHECKLLLQVNDHVEWMRFILLNIGETKMILGHNWLLRHNLEINWVT